MQLGGGCASGTLFTVGGGHVRMLITLAFFVTGATIDAVGTAASDDDIVAGAGIDGFTLISAGSLEIEAGSITEDDVITVLPEDAVLAAGPDEDIVA